LFGSKLIEIRSFQLQAILTCKRNDSSAKKSSHGGDEQDSDNKSDNIQSAFAAASLRKMLEEIRLAQANAELSRFQLLRRLDSLKVR
jgi:hypothetical protein